jgi:hypothetical protein
VRDYLSGDGASWFVSVFWVTKWLVAEGATRRDEEISTIEHSLAGPASEDGNKTIRMYSSRSSTSRRRRIVLIPK